MPTQDHPVFVPPADIDVPIWRYMDFTKFLSMLENGGLYFSRADLLGDAFEGSFSRGNEKLRPMVYKDSKIPPESFEQMGRFSRWIRGWTHVNCWHMSRHESAAMWNLYAKTHEAIAIRSTFRKLRDALDTGCFVGVVQYIDYETQWLPEGNSLSPFMHKRLSYVHEQEVRAVIQTLPTKDGAIDHNASFIPGQWRLLSLDTLIDDIYVAPTAPQWFRELVTKVVSRYGFSKPVIQSSLDKEPFF